MNKVSVVIPTHNRESTIGRAIESVLNQTHDNIELIIVDDNSTDNTVSIVNKYSEKHKNKCIKYVGHEKNKGANAARNTGIKIADGSIVSFLDSDDEFHPEYIERCVEKLQSLPNEYAGVYTSFNLYKDSRMIRVSKAKQDITLEQILLENLIGGFSTITLQKDILFNVGLLDENLKSYQDRDLFVRILLNYKLWGIDEPLLNYYLQDDSITNNFDKKLDGLNAFWEKHSEKMSTSARAQMHYTLANLYAKNGEVTKCKKEYLTAIKRNPTNLLYYYHYISSLLGKKFLFLSFKLKDWVKNTTNRVG